MIPLTTFVIYISLFGLGHISAWVIVAYLISRDMRRERRDHLQSLKTISNTVKF